MSAIFILLKVAHDNAAKRIGLVAKTLERFRIELYGVADGVPIVFWLNAVVRTLQVSMHRIVIERGLGTIG